jgi:hypothetical protein
VARKYGRRMTEQASRAGYARRLEVRAGLVLVPLEVAEANRSHVARLERGQLSVFLGIAS